ncbi:hypothetical protein ACU18_05945 [Arthrobacter sp. ZBG10]|jgi:hypothetical protein|uniref:hypothetical protein n=1 Tax=unclassified Arthrobacter TaxID=235627 RepID=UPI0006800EA0|nr:MULTISPECIES: hypothetical protein [unclassified Arthrobacter]KNH19058.1 hypothetical protein ACU18_05945 [Arthrobacter sp. ZBG10]KQR00374.1 hypothetical protein ASF72_16115 [Arthrobacter sp. Leaf141]
MSAVMEAFSEGLLLLLCGAVLVVSVAGTVYLVRRRSLAPAGTGPERSDQLFWDLFLGAAVAVPALLIPTLAWPWAGLILGAAGVGAAVAAYRLSPRLLAWRAGRRDSRLQVSANQAARVQHDELMARWRRYELDPACSIDYPALTDVRLPETSALIKAMRTAEQLRAQPHRDYPAAVTGLALSLAAAERAAGLPTNQAGAA